MTNLGFTLALGALAVSSTLAQQPEPPAPAQIFIRQMEGIGAGADLGFAMAESKFKVEMGMESKVVKALLTLPRPSAKLRRCWPTELESVARM